MQPTDINDIKNIVTNLKTKCTVGFDSLSIKRIQQTIKEKVIPLGHKSILFYYWGCPNKSNGCESNSNI